MHPKMVAKIADYRRRKIEALASVHCSASLYLEMLTMLLIFKANIEVGIWPMKGSPCHKQLKRIVKAAEKHRPPNTRTQRRESDERSLK